MKSAGTNQLLATVEETTGYKVVIDTVEGIREDAQMISARPASPVHTINVSKARLRYADYIVANQCAILLRVWADAARIPVCPPIAEKVRYFTDRTAGGKAFARLPANLAQEAATRFATGVLHQVRSMPLEILAVRDCREQCPDLAELQAESIEGQLRFWSDHFAPKVRATLPEEIWQKSVSMNSAFALNWAELSGSSLAMLPYESAGFEATARRLLADVKAKSAKTPEAYTGLVDAWAEQLGIRTLYKWEYRKGGQ